MVILRRTRNENLKSVNKRQLDEMAICPISSLSEGLPFKIAVKHPDHKPPHAHIMDLTGKKELGQCLIPLKFPNSPVDIGDYKQGISNEMRGIIFNWMRSRSVDAPEIRNWEVLYLAWLENERR